MDLRIGVINAPREIALELGDDTDVDALKSQIADAMSSETVLWVADKSGKQIAVNGAKIAYAELGTSEKPKMGFAAS